MKSFSLVVSGVTAEIPKDIVFVDSGGTRIDCNWIRVQSCTSATMPNYFAVEVSSLAGTRVDLSATGDTPTAASLSWAAAAVTTGEIEVDLAPRTTDRIRIYTSSAVAQYYVVSYGIVPAMGTLHWKLLPEGS